MLHTLLATIIVIKHGTRFEIFESILNICKGLDISFYNVLPQKVNLNNSNEDK